MKRKGRDQQQRTAGSQTPRHRRRFTQEFKLEAVRLAAVGDRRVSEVARDLGVRPEMLRQWKRQAEARAGHAAADVFPGNGKLISQDEEIRRLRRENAVLREERDILGKATAFFAKGVR
jgi:transposase